MTQRDCVMYVRGDLKQRRGAFRLLHNHCWWDVSRETYAKPWKPAITMEMSPKPLCSYFRRVHGDEDIEWPLEFAVATKAKLLAEETWRRKVGNDQNVNSLSAGAEQDVNRLKHQSCSWRISSAVHPENACLNDFVSEHRMIGATTSLNFVVKE